MIPVRKQVYLTAELERKLKSAARDRGKPEAEIVREALEAHLGVRPAAPSRDDPLESIYGVLDDPEPLDARDIDAIVYGGPTRCPACSSSTRPGGTRPSRARTRTTKR